RILRPLELERLLESPGSSRRDLADGLPVALVPGAVRELSRAIAPRIIKMQEKDVIRLAHGRLFGWTLDFPREPRRFAGAWAREEIRGETFRLGLRKGEVGHLPVLAGLERSFEKRDQAPHRPLSRQPPSFSPPLERRVLSVKGL